MAVGCGRRAGSGKDPRFILLAAMNIHRSGCLKQRLKSSLTARADTIQHFVQDMAPHWWVYGFVAKHGRLFGPRRPLRKKSAANQPQMCFWNAYVLTSLRPELIYVEGFARFAIGGNQSHIVHHAWAVDSGGRVLDPTLKGTEYFGIPFKAEYVKRTMHRILPTGFSILDNELDSLRKSKNSKAWLFKT